MLYRDKKILNYMYTFGYKNKAQKKIHAKWSNNTYFNIWTKFGYSYEIRGLYK